MTLREMNVNINPMGDSADDLALTEELVTAYGLEKWAGQFSLMTAGYRDHMDPNAADSAEAPFNVVSVAVMAEARARVLRRCHGDAGVIDVHIGGEVRANTQTFIQIAARIYAAHGFRVHLRQGVSTSPIWYSSFGVFYKEYEGGDNFTASHSPYFKQGWKVLDGAGKQLSEGEDDLIEEVRQVIRSRATIRLAPWKASGLIHSDFDIDDAYAQYQRSPIGSEVLATISEAATEGFLCAATPLGGAMGATAKRIFRLLGVPESAVSYFLDEEDSRFHRVGEIGEDNFGADVGRVAVCERTGAPEKLLSGEAHLVLLWDPDGDRLNLMTTAPSAIRDRALDYGLSIVRTDGPRMVVCFTPNQLYLLLAEYLISLLKKQQLLEKYDWFVGTSFPTALMIEELALQEGVPTVRVPVGFRNLGGLCQEIETRLGAEQTVRSMTGRETRLGPEPRAMMLCEESGGAALGGPDLMRSESGRRAMLALREKDGLQLSLFAWAMAVAHHRSGLSLAEQYCDIISRRQIEYRYNQRIDVSLYDESLTGAELKLAKEVGIERRDRVVEFFRTAATALAEGRQSESQVRQMLGDANSADREALTPISAAAWIRDGSLFEMDGARLIIRASGTDALIRYYIDATSHDRLDALQRFVSGLSF